MADAPAAQAVTRATPVLLDPDFLARLEQLEIVSRKIHASRQKGERKSRRKGESAEFADYRNYVIGDDLRHIDWNIYARLDRLFLKLFLAEEDLNVSVLFDVSGSMEFGAPPKSLYVKRVAAAMAYIGLCNYDRVNLWAYNDRIVDMRQGLRGRRMMAQIVRFLEGLPVEGGSHFTAAARQFAMRQSQKGVVLILSDFMDKGGFEGGLRYLLGRSMDVYVLQILSRDEVEPPLAGDLKLVDAEDGESAEVTISKPLLDRYKANLAAWCDSIRGFCMARGASYHLAITDQPFEALVLNYLRRRGLVR